MSADQDYLKQNVAATQDQVEKVSAQARQATRESFQAAQQTQQTVAQGAERLSQQGGRVASTAFDTAWDSWLATLGMVSWSQDQTEKAMRQLMDQGRVSREEGARLLRDLGEQAKRNQTELQRMIQEGVRASLQAFQVPEAALRPMMTMMTPPQPATPPVPVTPPSITPAQFDELNRKIDALNSKVARTPTATASPAQVEELSQKIDALNTKVGRTPTATASSAQLDELTKKVDELTKKLDALNKVAK